MSQFVMGSLASISKNQRMAATIMIEQQLPFIEPDETSDWKETDERILAAEEKGKVMDAKKIAASAVQTARKAVEESSKNMGQLLYCLEARANLFNRQGDFRAAESDYVEVLSLATDTEGDANVDTVSRVYGNLAYLFEAAGEESKAISAYEDALEHLSNSKEPSVTDQIRFANNLAFIYSANDDFDQAETLFLKALRAAHNTFGASAPDSTGVFNNIGALYQKAGHFDQAREMHAMALDGRKEEGSSLSDIAQSHGNLAIVYAEQGDEEKSREHFESAIEVFQKAGPQWKEDYDAVCANYEQLLRNVGDVDGEGRVAALRSQSLS